MVDPFPYYELFPAGFLIAQDCKQYCGVDRLPTFIDPELEVRKFAGVPPVRDANLYTAIEEWFDHRSKAAVFITEHSQAARLIEAFRLFDFDLDLLYCELALNIDEKARLDAYKKVESARPALLETYGFDVSWPTCNHSAIRPPGIVHEQPAWLIRLNQYGLLDHFNDALELRAEYLRVYPYPPFDTYLVHRVL